MAKHKPSGMSAVHAAMTHCVNGHEFTPENTYHRPDRPLSRACRQCMKDRKRVLRQGFLRRGIVWNLSKSRKRGVLDRCGRRCHWCGQDATTVDHVVPLRDGGSNDDANLVAACLSCNSAHAGRDAAWRAA